jgi:hypothetical protein
MYGYRFTKKNLVKTTQVRSCEHPISVGDKFCSECGKPAFKDKEVQLMWDGDQRAKPFDVEMGNQVKGYRNDHEDYYVIGATIITGYCNVVDLSVYNSDFQQVLLDKLVEMDIDASKGLLGLHLVHYFG